MLKCNEPKCEGEAKWFIYANMAEHLLCDQHCRGQRCDDGILHPISDLGHSCANPWCNAHRHAERQLQLFVRPTGDYDGIPTGLAPARSR